MRYIKVDNWLRHIQGWILPPRCVLCGCEGRAPAQDLCSYCQREFVRNAAACRGCALPVGPPGRELCARCLRHARGFDTAFAPFRYEYPLDRLLQRFKYQGQLALGRVLGSLLAEAVVAEHIELPQALVPVPLARSKQRERGFNQAYELARPLARALKLPIRTDLCARTRATRDQATLRAHDRRRNVVGAFVATGSVPPRHVAVIDDVLTTGSTCEELARVLKRAGIERVDVWVIARAAPPKPS
jgi:ComF family protein